MRMCWPGRHSTYAVAPTRNVSDLLSAGFSLEYQDLRACFALRAPSIPPPISDPSTSQQDRSGSILHNSLLSLKTGVDDTSMEAARESIAPYANEPSFVETIGLPIRYMRKMGALRCHVTSSTSKMNKRQFAIWKGPSSTTWTRYAKKLRKALAK